MVQNIDTMELRIRVLESLVIQLLKAAHLAHPDQLIDALDDPPEDVRNDHEASDASPAVHKRRKIMLEAADIFGRR